MTGRRRAVNALDLACDVARQFEGLELIPYRDVAGYPTLGYGRLLGRDRTLPLTTWTAISRDTNVVVREVVLRPGDTLQLCGIEVTTELRTAIDLARHPDFDPLRDGSTIARLVTADGLAACRAHLASATKLPNKKLALVRITDALLEHTIRSRG